MNKFRVRKFVGKIVEITFKDDIFNIATQSWILSTYSFVGVLREVHLKHSRITYFCIEKYSNLVSNVFDFCFSANKLKSIKEVVVYEQ